jgi:hypothetical protein
MLRKSAQNVADRQGGPRHKAATMPLVAARASASHPARHPRPHANSNILPIGKAAKRWTGLLVPGTVAHPSTCPEMLLAKVVTTVVATARTSASEHQAPGKPIDPHRQV